MRKLALAGAVILVVLLSFVGGAAAQPVYVTPPGTGPDVGASDAGRTGGGGAIGGGGRELGRAQDSGPGWLAYTGIALGSLVVVGGTLYGIGRYMRRAAGGPEAQPA